ncbi:MAG: glycosyltransferase [Bifidobacteriaceae bacterium]|nr:glycosyltransferase [Bifidobacteriaceae bacterium]
MAQAVFRLRAHFYRAHAKRAAAGQVQPPRSVSWRRELGKVADLDAALTMPLVRLQPDIIHANDVYALSVAVNAKAILARRSHPVKLVYDAHEYVAGYPRWTRRLEVAYQKLERALAPKFDAVVTVSEPIADAMWRELRLPRRPVVVHNSPDPSRVRPASGGTVRQAAGLPPGAPLVVYSGVIQAQRNVAGVIKALPLLEGVHFAIVCVPSTKVPLAQELIPLAQEAGVADRVHLLEPVDPPEIASYLAGADLGVDPMDTDFGQHAYCLPNKLWDYLQAGLPVAVSNNQLERQLVEADGLGAVFDPSSAQSIAAAIRQVLDQAAAYRAKVAASSLVQQYAWPGQVARLVALYQELSGRREASR